MKNSVTYLFYGAFAVFLTFGAVRCSQSSSSTDSNIGETMKVTSIYFSDGDSGQINGFYKFRLRDVDAPETGGVGAAIGGAKCELERKRGFDSKAWIVSLTKGAAVEISQTYDADRYGRTVIDLSVDGQDIGKMGLAAGHYKPWPHKNGKAISKRPVWC